MLPWGGCSAFPWASGWAQPHPVHIYPVLSGAFAFWTKQRRMTKDCQWGKSLFLITQDFHYYRTYMVPRHEPKLMLREVLHTHNGKQALSSATEVEVKRKQITSTYLNFLNVSLCLTYLVWSSLWRQKRILSLLSYAMLSQEERDLVINSQGAK